jgi:hypothetical protein
MHAPECDILLGCSLVSGSLAVKATFLFQTPLPPASPRSAGHTVCYYFPAHSIAFRAHKIQVPHDPHAGVSE